LGKMLLDCEEEVGGIKGKRGEEKVRVLWF
jgi:hypothetical protein